MAHHAAVEPPHKHVQPGQTHMATGCQSPLTQPPGMSHSVVSINLCVTNTCIINPSLSSHNFVSDNAVPGVSSDSLPHVDIISPSVKKDIIMGKDINLASLLIPDYQQALTLPEFMLAFKSTTSPSLFGQISVIAAKPQYQN